MDADEGSPPYFWFLPINLKMGETRPVDSRYDYAGSNHHGEHFHMAIWREGSL